MKKAYRGASNKWHPDKNPGTDTTDMFIYVKDGTDILENSFKRSAYDLFGQMRFDEEQKMYDQISLSYNVDDV